MPINKAAKATTSLRVRKNVEEESDSHYYEAPGESLAKRFRIDPMSFLFPAGEEPCLGLKMDIWSDQCYPIADPPEISPEDGLPLFDLFACKSGTSPKTSAPLSPKKPHSTDRLQRESVAALEKFLGWDAGGLMLQWECFLLEHPVDEFIPETYVDEMKPLWSSEAEEHAEDLDNLFNALNTIFAWRLPLFKAVQGSRQYARLTKLELKHGINCLLGSKLFP